MKSTTVLIGALLSTASINLGLAQSPLNPDNFREYQRLLAPRVAPDRPKADSRPPRRTHGRRPQRAVRLYFSDAANSGANTAAPALQGRQSRGSLFCLESDRA